MTNSVSSKIPAPPDQTVANPGPVRPPRIYLATILLGMLGRVFWRDNFVFRVIGLPAGALLVALSVALEASTRRWL